MLDSWIWLRIAYERKEWEKENGNNENIIEDNWQRGNVKWVWSRIGEMRDEINEIRKFLGRKCWN